MSGTPEKPALDEPQIPRRVLRRSLVLATVGTSLGAFFFGLAGGNIFNRFLESIGYKEQLYLFLGVAGLSGVFQVLGSWVLQRTGRRRTFFFAFTLPSRLLWILVAWLPAVLAQKRLLLGTLLALAFAYWVASGLAGNAWFSWMRDLVPREIRGRYFGYRATVVTLVGALWGLAAGYLLERLGLSGRAFRIVYVVGVVFGILDILTYLLVYHPPLRPRPPELATFAGMWRAVMRKDFKVFTAVSSLWFFSTAIVALSIYYLQRAIGMEIYQIQVAAFVGTVVWLVFSPLWGQFLDRYGSKATYMVSLITHALSPILYALAARHGITFVYLGFVVGSIGASGMSLADTNLLFETANREDQPMAFAAHSMTIGLVSAAAYFFTGRLMYPLFQKHTPAWADEGTFYLLGAFSVALILRWIAVALSTALPEAEGRPSAWVVVRMFYSTNPLLAVYSLTRFLRAKSSDMLADGSYGREHPSARWQA